MIEPMGRKVDGQTSASIDKTAQASKSPDRCIWEDSASAEEFMQKRPQFDQEMSKKRQTAEDAGGVLRFVGVVDMVNQKGEVKLQTYKNDHLFAQLSGADNIIALTTIRYKAQPQIIRGPGATAEVTAGEVLSDLLRLASYLGAPS